MERTTQNVAASPKSNARTGLLDMNQIQDQGEADFEVEKQRRLAARTPMERAQDACMAYYMGECMGHRFHLTETVCLIVFGLSLAAAYLLMKGALFNDGFLAMSLIFIGFIATAFVWGYIKVASLTETVNTLQLVMGKADQECKQYAKINDDLERQTNVYKQRVDQLGNEVEGVQGHAITLDELTVSLQEMQDKMEALNEEQIQMGDYEDAYINEQNIAKVDEANENTKKAFKQMFDLMGTANGYLEGDQAMRKIQEIFTERKVPWSEECKEAVSDGRVYKYELLSALDAALQTRYFRIKSAPTDLKMSRREYEEKVKSLELLAIRNNIQLWKFKVLRELHPMPPELEKKESMIRNGKFEQVVPTPPAGTPPASKNMPIPTPPTQPPRQGVPVGTPGMFTPTPPTGSTSTVLVLPPTPK